MATIVVIGGGAAGFFSAIHAKQACPSACVLLLEKSNALLSKVKISGGGRCNVTHSCFDPRVLAEHYPRGNKALIGVFHRFQPEDTMAWFESRGVSLKTESDNRVFPVTDSSQTIMDCLIQEARSLGVVIRKKQRISCVEQLENGFSIGLEDGDPIMADAVILCTGSASFGHETAQKLGHTIVPLYPSLFTFTVADERLRCLAGIGMKDVEVSMTGPLKLTQRGGLLITHWGLSGPSIIKLSAWGARALAESGYQADITVNWVPQFTMNEVQQQLNRVKMEHPKKEIRNKGLFSEIPSRLWAMMLECVSISPGKTWGSLTDADVVRVIQGLTACPFKVNGKGVFKDEFVTSGGVALSEVDFKTMESKRCAGLYFAGEILDIDGVTGGFNFQNAWSTGYLAGTSQNVS